MPDPISPSSIWFFSPAPINPKHPEAVLNLPAATKEQSPLAPIWLLQPPAIVDLSPWLSKVSPNLDGTIFKLDDPVSYTVFTSSLSSIILLVPILNIWPVVVS